MNIISLSSTGYTTVRPDTTRERDGDAVYMPDYVSALSFAPVVFARADKPAKSVGERFAPRYWGTFGVGLLLYPEGDLFNSPEGFANSCILDHTSCLTLPLWPRADMGSVLRICCGGKDIYRSAPVDPTVLDRTLSRVSSCCLCRVGDFVAAELSPRLSLHPDCGFPADVQVWYGDQKVMEFSIFL